ncbi:FAD-dependent oxidoreductase [Streptomyces sp. M10(2022)]
MVPEGRHARDPRAMADAAADAGADLRWSAEVSTLERSAGRVRAVRLASGERIACDAVVLTCELPTAYDLLGRRPLRPARLRHSPSAVILHAGTDRTWPQLAHHTISFGGAWERTFDELTRTGELMSDPSAHHPADHPRPVPGTAGTSPPLRSGPCPNTTVGPGPPRGGTSARATATVWSVNWNAGAWTGSPTASRKRSWSPLDWAAQGHAAGSPFSVSHTFAQTGPFRPRNLVRGVENVVLAGCGTTPGVGVPTVLISGKLAAARITGGTGPGSVRARPLPATAGVSTVPAPAGTDDPS